MFTIATVLYVSYSYDDGNYYYPEYILSMISMSVHARRRDEASEPPQQFERPESQLGEVFGGLGG
jgi:hypothetical protein